MNHQDVIDWKLAQLQSDSQEPMPEAMQAYVQQHPALVAELNTLEQFWLQPSPLPAPAESVRTRFYQSLAELQEQSRGIVTPLETATKPIKPKSYSILGQHPWLQAAVIAVVFVLGVFIGRSPQPGPEQQGLAELQREVASLSTVMAISMLQHQSASQRLAGVSYTRQANLADPVLLETLMTSLSEESSTAVKLAIIDALRNKDGFEQIEQPLVALALQEQQPLVQMALCRLLLEQGSTTTKRQLIEQLRQQPLDQDVEEFLQLIDAQHRV